MLFNCFKYITACFDVFFDKIVKFFLPFFGSCISVQVGCKARQVGPNWFRWQLRPEPPPPHRHHCHLHCICRSQICWNRETFAAARGYKIDLLEIYVCYSIIFYSISLCLHHPQTSTKSILGSAFPNVDVTFWLLKDTVSNLNVWWFWKIE